MSSGHTLEGRPGDGIQRAFEAFHAKYPEVYAEIVSIARDMRNRGRSHYSIDAIIQVVRFHRDLKTTDAKGFKINNDFRSRYARLVMRMEPDLDGFFETRRLQSTRESA